MSETTHGSEQYAYEDQTAPATEGISATSASQVEEASQAVLNPAYYPASAKPEALYNEAEKAGSDFPTADPAAVASGQDSDGEDLTDEDVSALTDGSPTPVPAGQGAEPEGDVPPEPEGDEIDQALEGNVEDGESYALDHPDQVDELIAREEAGKNRSTLLASLESIKEAKEEPTA